MPLPVVGTVRTCFELVGSRWRRRWIWLIPASLVAAALELVGTGSIFVLVRLISDPSAVDSISWLAYIRPRSSPDPRASLTVIVALLIAVLSLVKAGVRLLEVSLRQRCAMGSARDLATTLLSTYLRAPYAFHLRRNSSESARNVKEGAGDVALSLRSATTALTELLMTAAVVVILVWVTPGPLFAVACGFVLLAVSILAASQRMVRRIGLVFHRQTAIRDQVLRASLQGQKEIQLLGRWRFFAREFDEVSGRLADAHVSWAIFEWVPRLAVEAVFVCGFAGLVLAARLFGTEEWRVTPVLGMFAYAALRILPSFHLVVYHLSRVEVARPSVDALRADYAALRGLEPGDAAEGARMPFHDRIEVHAISYVYDEAPRQALHDVDFTIARGESVGIVGPTGAGKSTLIDLMLGLLRPSAGRIEVDGRDIHGAISEWQRQIGYVPQTPFLVDASIRANIAFGVEPARIDEARVAAVARMAQLQPFLDGLPQGLDSVVGENGVRISGGERQRIAIARALYHDPAVLVFDEATSALDNRTEKDLTRTIDGLRGEKTMVIVAHRLTSVAGCDRLIFLSGGRVADVGTYSELLHRSPAFQRMAASAQGEMS